MFQLRLFGGVSLEGPAGPVTGRAGQRRPLALLSLLAASESFTVSRDKIIASLWPERGAKRARHLLSVTLHALRKELGSESVLSVADDLRLNTDLVAVDVVEFREALEAEEWERAVSLYAGPFLDGFHVRDARGFERWLDGQRAEHARGYRRALEELAEEAEGRAAWSEAVAWWKERAAEEPTSSRVAIRLMKALEASGDRPAALHHARVHALLVREELGVEPDPEVATLAERLENGEVEREEWSGSGTVGPGVSTLESPSGSSEFGQSSSRVELGGVSRHRHGGREDAPEQGDRSAHRPGSGDRPLLRSHPQVVAIAAAVLFAGGTLVVLASTAGEEPAYDPKRVLVDVFENRTEDPALDGIGRMAADWITQGLTYTGFVDVVTLGTPFLAGQSASEGFDAPSREKHLERVARANGTGTLVWGSLHRRGESVYFRAHVTDARDHRELAALGPVSASVETPAAGLEELRDRVMTALATLTDPRLARWQRHASKPPTFEAYQKFVEGLELHTTERRYSEAADRFREAAALDPDFTMAKLWEILSLREVASREAWDEASRILGELEERREGLARLDRAFLNYHLGEIDGDEMRMLRAARRMVEIAPGSEYLRMAGTAALWARRPAEAVRHLERADPESGWLRGWTPYWRYLAVAYHWLSNYERAVEVARRGAALHPRNLSIRNQEIRALAAQGRIEEVEEALADLRGLEHHVGTALKLAGRELVAHGYEREGREYYLRAIDWRRRRLEEGGGDSREHRLELVRLLRTVGELEQADRQLAVLLADDPDDPYVIRVAALLRATQGRREEAMEYVRRFDELGEKIFLDLEPSVAALLGDRERAMGILRRFEENWRLYRFWYIHAPTLRSLWNYPPFREFMRPRG